MCQGLIVGYEILYSRIYFFLLCVSYLLRFVLIVNLIIMNRICTIFVATSVSLENDWVIRCHFE